MKPEVIFENEDYVAFAKPSGLLSIPDRYNPDIPNLVTIARRSFSNIYVVHRIDRDTSGVVCFAKNEQAHRYLSGLFAKHENITKQYLAIVNGCPANHSDSLSFPLQAHPAKKGRMMVVQKGKFTRTDFEVLESWNHFSLLKIKLFTGRTHQIRVHFSHIGNPIVGDTFYGNGQPFFLSSVKRKYRLSDNDEAERPVISRLALHASELSFKTERGEAVRIQAPLPKDMSVMVKLLTKWDK